MTLQQIIESQSEKRERWLYFRTRIPVYLHSGITWVKDNYGHDTLITSALFLIRVGLLSLAAGRGSNVRIVKNREVISPEISDVSRPS